MRNFTYLEAPPFENARKCLETARLLEQASYHLKQDEPQSALALARSVLSEGGEGFAPYAMEVIEDALDDIAMHYRDVEDWATAQRWQKELVASDPSACSPRLTLAEDMIMTDDCHLAVQELRQLLSRCPYSIEGWVWVARCAINGAESSKDGRSTDHKRAVRDLLRFARRSWHVLRKPRWVSYPDETIARITVEGLYIASVEALAFAGRTDQARQVAEMAIATLGGGANHLQRLCDSLPPDVQYHLDTASLLSAIDHMLVRRLLELVRQCDAINALVDNRDYEQAFARLDALPADTDELLNGWKTWRERWLLFRAAENAANAQDIEAEMRYIARWRQISPLEEFPLFRWGELMYACDHKQALRALHLVLRRSEKHIEALIEIARVHYVHRRLQLASRFVAKAWECLPSPDWCYYPSEAVVQDRLRKLFVLTQKLVAASGKVERAEYIRRESEALLGSPWVENYLDENGWWDGGD